MLTPVEQVATRGDFQIMHVGSFFGTRNPDELLECLAEIKRDDIVFVQVGGSFDSYAAIQGQSENEGASRPFHARTRSH